MFLSLQPIKTECHNQYNDSYMYITATGLKVRCLSNLPNYFSVYKRSRLIALHANRIAISLQLRKDDIVMRASWKNIYTGTMTSLVPSLREKVGSGDKTTY